MLNDQQKYLAAKYNPNEQAIFDVIKNYAEEGRFREAYHYLNRAMYFHANAGEVYYSLITKYLSSPAREASVKDSTPLLITWTIAPKNVPFLNMVDPQKRLWENMLGLAAWILDKSFHKIIVTESSNFKINVDRLKQIGKEYNKEIEYYTFSNSEKVSQFGKGYGEGEILKHTFANSPSINSCSKFTKMNGKQYVPFYEYFLIDGGNTFEYFNLHFIANKLAIDTRFYCIDKEYYLNTLFDSYQECNDYKDNYLEHVFYEKTKNRVNYFIPTEPIVLGRQGSIEKNYGEYPPVVKKFCEYLMVELV
jgi:hypothetical protein